MAKRARFNAMALLAVMIMWLAERGPPSIVLLQQSKDTQRAPEHNADFVPGNKIRELRQLRFIKEASRVGLGFADFR